MRIAIADEPGRESRARSIKIHQKCYKSAQNNENECLMNAREIDEREGRRRRERGDDGD